MLWRRCAAGLYAATRSPGSGPQPPHVPWSAAAPTPAAPPSPPELPPLRHCHALQATNLLPAASWRRVLHGSRCRHGWGSPRCPRTGLVGASAAEPQQPQQQRRGPRRHPYLEPPSPPLQQPAAAAAAMAARAAAVAPGNLQQRQLVEPSDSPKNKTKQPRVQLTLGKDVGDCHPGSGAAPPAPAPDIDRRGCSSRHLLLVFLCRCSRCPLPCWACRHCLGRLDL